MRILQIFIVGLMMMPFLCDAQIGIPNINAGSLSVNLNQKALSGNRFKFISASKNTKPVSYKATDFIQFNSDGKYEEALLGIYATGTWKINGDTVYVTKGNIQKWKISELKASSFKAVKGADQIEMEKVVMPSLSVSNATSTQQKMCGSWKIASHKKGQIAVNYKPNDFIRFYSDGTYEQSLMSVYTKATWTLSSDEKQITANGAVWNLINLNAGSLKASKAPNETLELTR